MASKDEVREAIDSERKYQDKLNGRLMLPGEELLLLEEYVMRARKTYSDTFGDPEEKPTMIVIRKIAAIAFRAMENHGAFPR